MDETSIQTTEETPEESLEQDLGHDNDKYPLLVRIYGVMCIVASVIEIIAIVLGIIAVVALFTSADIANLEITGHASLTTMIITIVAVALSIALAVMFIILGLRLLRSSRHKVATIANIMIILEVFEFICQYMLNGFTNALFLTLVNLIILIALEAYSDPSLRQERQLQRRLQQLEDRSDQEEGTLGLDKTGKGYITLNFFNVFWVFVVCCFLGLVLETIWHMTVVEFGVYQDRAGLIYGPFSPIYGFGAVLMTVALNRFYKANPIVIFLVAGLIGAAFEYFVSWFLETAFGIVAWDYSGTFLNINGRTNFMFFCIWGVLGLLWLRYLLPVILGLINKIPWNWRYIVTTIFAIFMVADGLLTLIAFDCWYQRAAGTMDYENCSAIVAFCNEHYDDEFMEARFQSMTMTTDDSSRAE